MKKQLMILCFTLVLILSSVPNIQALNNTSNIKMDVTFDANGGEGTMADEVIKKGDTKPLTPNTFTKNGYVFKGWATSKNGPFTYLDGTDYKMETDKNETLYAVWEAQTFSINFNANGATGTMSGETVVFGQKVTLSPNTFTKTGAHFKGWALSSDGEVKYNDGDTFTFDQAEDLSLFAVWTNDATAVVFDSNGGEGSMPNQMFEFDEVRPLTMNQFTKKDYHFTGWATSPTGEVVYKDGAEYQMSNTSEVVLYAVWGKVDLSITGLPKNVYVGDKFTLKAAFDETFHADGWQYDTSFFDVNFTNEATFTAIKSGTTEIKYTAVNGDSASIKVTIQEKSKPNNDLWIWLAGGGGGILVIGLIIYLVTKKKEDKPSDGTTSEEDDEVIQSFVHQHHEED